MNTSVDDVYDIIISLDSNKVHGWDNISMIRLRILEKSKAEQLIVICKALLNIRKSKKTKIKKILFQFTENESHNNV